MNDFDAQLRSQISVLAAGEISVDEFDDWFAQGLWDDDSDLTTSVEAVMIEYMDGVIGHEELRKRLSAMVEFAHSSPCLPSN